MLGAVSASYGQLINLNFTDAAALPAEATLSGPAGGLGTAWNQSTTVDAGVLNDSTGALTTVSIDTSGYSGFTNEYPDGDLPVFGSFLGSFARPGSYTVTINGLEAGGFYDIWLLCYRDNASATERSVGTWSTTNSTTSPSAQLVDGTLTTPGGASFLEGYNYVLFSDVEATAGGVISFTGESQGFGSPQDINSRRLHLNGLQIEKTTPPVVGDVDEAVSTVEASPTTVFADGVLTSTVTVTLKDSNGNGVPGKDVTLANTAGPQAATIDPLVSVSTNAAGQAIFAVSSNSPGIEEFTATDVTDSNLVITQTASVEFVEVGVLSDADQSTVMASPPSVVADGSSTSTVTVTLRDANGYPVSGKEVSLVNTAGSGTPVISPSGTVNSDPNGEAVFTVSSSTIGAEEFTATDTTDGIGIAEVATVGFIDPNAPKMISVNFTDAVDMPVEATLSGPAGGLGTAWNQSTTVDTGVLNDSTGSPTTVSVDTSGYSGFTNEYPDGGLPVFGSFLGSFDRPNGYSVTINGLEAGGFYDIWLMSYRDNAASTERSVGTWSTTNATTSPSAQLVDGTATTPGGASFLEGYNYVLFSNVEASEGGVISFTGESQGFGSPQDGNSRRLHLSGIQIEETAPPLARILTFGVPGIDGVIDEGAKTITLDVPFGTDLAALAPEFTLSSGVCNQGSGSPPSPTFATQNPVPYVVTDDSTDPDTVNTYSVSVKVAADVGSIVIDLGTSPAGTVIEGGAFGTYGAANLPLPSLPAGSILRSIEVATKLEGTDNDNFASDLAVLLDPTPGTPGDDFILNITNGTLDFGATSTLGWPAAADVPPVAALADTKTDADWTGDIDLATTGLFLGNAFDNTPGTPDDGGTWSGTITLTYDLVGGGADYETWAAGFLPDDVSNPTGDFDGDGLTNDDERAFGLDPTDSSSVNPFSTPLDPVAGTFSYTRRDAGLSGLTYTIWTSSDLQVWTQDLGATAGQSPGPVVGGIQSVDVVLTAAPIDGKLFVRVRAN